jgi:hypothetical protein
MEKKFPFSPIFFLQFRRPVKSNLAYPEAHGHGLGITDAD